MIVRTIVIGITMVHAFAAEAAGAASCDDLGSHQWVSADSLATWHAQGCVHPLDDGRAVPQTMFVVTARIMDERNEGLLYTALFRQRQLFPGAWFMAVDNDSRRPSIAFEALVDPSFPTEANVTRWYPRCRDRCDKKLP